MLSFVKCSDNLAFVKNQLLFSYLAATGYQCGEPLIVVVIMNLKIWKIVCINKHGPFTLQSVCGRSPSFQATALFSFSTSEVAALIAELHYGSFI